MRIVEGKARRRNAVQRVLGWAMLWPQRAQIEMRNRKPLTSKVFDMVKQLTAIIEKEDDGYVALCPEVDVASQGDSVGEARENLKEALELFFEMSSPEEINSRLHDEVYVTHVEVAVG